MGPLDLKSSNLASELKNSVCSSAGKPQPFYSTGFKNLCFENSTQAVP